ncbi:MAG: MBL fold metallo-hydrolase [Spirochaetaceae bacterium]|nr:MBL fold metallo-hydrolase [Spirochaetaceae bacterium]
MNNPLISITDNISYLPASTKPLSCDVIFIKTENATWIYDVGVTSTACELINNISGPKNIVLSHFHPDHIINLFRVKYDNLYLTKYTKRCTFRGNIVKGREVFEGNPRIEICEVPSSHAKGCLCLVCGDYAFMGDSTYCKEKIGNHTYNVQLLKAEIDFLESLTCKYVCLDHDNNFIQERTALIKLHKEIFERRKPGETTICVEDFFNPDGSVKVPENS